MQRFLAAFLVALLMASFLPSEAQARLLCRMTGEVMQPVAVQDNPGSCCAVSLTATGDSELANRSCCDLKITPGRSLLPPTLFTPVSNAFAALPTGTLCLAPPIFIDLTPGLPLFALPLYRGSPPTLASPRGPPALS